MQEKAAEEVHGVEGHDALSAAVGIIAPEEADALPVEGGDAVVADSHAMGVAAKIAQHMLRSAEGRLGMDVPFLGKAVLPRCGSGVSWQYLDTKVGD
jgi:hypothetical protein